MITCVDCSRVLLNDVKPFDPRTTATYRSQVHAQIRAARHQHTCPKGTAMQDQCSRCDSVSDCLDSGITTLEDVAGVIGAPAPSLHVHLVQHDRDDLLRGMTYGGEPILPFEPEPAAEVAEIEPAAEVAEIEAVPEVAERSCACDKWVFDPGEDDYRETLEDGLTILHKVEQCIETTARRMDDDVLEVPSEWADEVQRLAQADAAEILHNDSLAWLVAHDDPEIREAAAALQVLISRKAHDWMLRAEIERLMVERDHLTQRIEEMQAALQGEPEPEPVPLAAEPARRTTTAEIRAWCVANDVPVPQRGTLPRAAVEAYEAAHEVSA